MMQLLMAQLGISLGLGFFAVRLAGRPGTPKILRWLPQILILAFVLSAGVAYFAMRRAVDAYDGVAPERRKEILTDAMQSSLTAVGVGVAFTVLVAIALTVIWFRTRNVAEKLRTPAKKKT